MALASLTPDDSAPRAHYLRAAAVMANSQNDVEARESLARESLRVATASDDPDAMALSLAWLSIPLAMSGNLIEAVELAESSLSLARAIASWPSQAVATAALCNILPMAGQSERAIELGEEGVGISEARGELWARGYMLGATSQVHWRQGDRQLAEVQARAGAATKHVIDDRSGLQLLLETLAWMAAEGGVHARAAVILGSAEHVRQASGLEIPDAQRQQHERSIALALEGLGQRTYDESYERGLAMTTEDAVAFAVEDRLPAGQDGRQAQDRDPPHQTGAGDRRPHRARDDQSRHRDQALHLGANGRGACHQHAQQARSELSGRTRPLVDQRWRHGAGHARGLMDSGWRCARRAIGAAASLPFAACRSAIRLAACQLAPSSPSPGARTGASSPSRGRARWPISGEQLQPSGHG